MLKRSTKIALIIIGLVSLLETAAFSGTYLIYSRHYVQTSNAKVDGDAIDINAPSTGTLMTWSLRPGSAINANEVVGRIQDIGGGAQPQRVIKAPRTATIAANNAVEGQYVTEGTKLATAYENVYVTARVSEDDIADVRPGDRVDITADAYPNTRLIGQVLEIQRATAGQFTIYPAAGTDPTNPQKVDQYVPVRILLLDSQGLSVMPGMNVEVAIRKSTPAV